MYVIIMSIYVIIDYIYFSFQTQVIGSIITITDRAHGIIDNIIEVREVNTWVGKDTSDKDQEFCSKIDETDIWD